MWDERSLLWSLREIQSAISKQQAKVESLIKMEVMIRFFWAKDSKFCSGWSSRYPLRDLIGDTDEQLVKWVWSSLEKWEPEKHVLELQHEEDIEVMNLMRPPWGRGTGEEGNSVLRSGALNSCKCPVLFYCDSETLAYIPSGTHYVLKYT